MKIFTRDAKDLKKLDLPQERSAWRRKNLKSGSEEASLPEGDSTWFRKLSDHLAGETGAGSDNGLDRVRNNSCLLLKPEPHARTPPPQRPSGKGV